MRTLRGAVIRLVVGLGACISTLLMTANVAQAQVASAFVTSYPSSIDTACGSGTARLFDECSDQLALFVIALEHADKERKVLLVEYGAEWCLWCHAFDAHITGERGQFRYTYGSQERPDERTTTLFREDNDPDLVLAPVLREFVAKHFVLVHIDSQHAPNGRTVLELTGAAKHAGDGVPFIFTVDPDGRYAAHFVHDAAAKLREGKDNEYRGYNRRSLLQQLGRMYEAAVGSSGE